ncbi:tryptophan-rich sensory protein [Candidatus Woesearchaeota archaeon]|nr:tryptophan-rich sensory protein [Candidatus Woesearchaeota archaeon]
MYKIDYKRLIISVVVPFIASAIGSVFTASSVNTWYIDLVKPSFNPPSWVFGPVWTVLYLMIGIALYLVWMKGFQKHRTEIAWFGGQLCLNALWSILFFGLRNPRLAFVEIIFLWFAILVTGIKFYKVSKPAGYLFLPYLLWVSFAGVLNYFIFILNL